MERMLIYLRFDLGYTQSEVAKRLELIKWLFHDLKKRYYKN